MFNTSEKESVITEQKNKIAKLQEKLEKEILILKIMEN